MISHKKKILLTLLLMSDFGLAISQAVRFKTLAIYDEHMAMSGLTVLILRSIIVFVLYAFCIAKGYGLQK